MLTQYMHSRTTIYRINPSRISFGRQALNRLTKVNTCQKRMHIIFTCGNNVTKCYSIKFCAPPTACRMERQENRPGEEAANEGDDDEDFQKTKKQKSIKR